MATTYATKAQRAKVIESIIDAEIEVGTLTDSEIAEREAELVTLSNPKLKRVCDETCPEEWSRLVV